MKKWLIIICFSFILISGVTARFYKLGAIPNSLNWDEVSWGYNAYSILTTGRDEYGFFLPLSFKAFGDYKQPVYVYLTTIPIKLFGLTPFSVRFTSAFFGSLSIIFLYFLILELFAKQRYARYYALFGMGLFAFSPWSIQFSRVAYEANVALFFVISGLTIFFRGVRNDKKLLQVVGVVLLAVSTYTYHSEKIITPLILIGALLACITYFMPRKKLALGLLIFFILCSSLWLLDLRTTARGRSVLFTSNSTQILGRSVQEIGYEKTQHLPFATVIHNRRVVYARQFVSNYLSHFNPTYLFLTGDQGQHHAPNMGILYLITLPFILIGIFVLIRTGVSASWFIFFWFLIAPVASSLAMDAPNASRNLIMAPTWDILAAVGFVFVICGMYKRKIGKSIIFLIALFMSINVIFYFHQYFVHTNKEAGQYWQYGYEQAMQEVVKLDNGGRMVYVADDIEQGYAFYLFYTKFDPTTYQKIISSQTDSSCRVIENKLFGNCQQTFRKGDILVTSKNPPFPNAKLLEQVNYLNGEKAVSIYEYE